MTSANQDIEAFTKSLSSLSFTNGDSVGHSILYKCRQSKSSLDIRRSNHLEKQRQTRFDYMNLVRDLTEVDWCTGNNESDNGYKQPRRPRFNADQLMLSEWMTEVPIDFEEEWLCMPCPMGKRCLVVASRGKTSAWTKTGNHLETFASNFPGGNSQHIKDNTILDCIYNKSLNTFYILDLMSWQGHPVYDSETEFRFYWLHTKLQEHPEIHKISKRNKMHFVALPSCLCTREEIYDALDKPVFTTEIDGVLFYHRRTHYTLGSTPLVGWLKPFMLPEIIDIDLPQRAKSTRPPNYIDYKTYIEKFSEKFTKRSPDGMFRNNNMLIGNKGKPIVKEKFIPKDSTPRTRQEIKINPNRTENGDKITSTVDKETDKHESHEDCEMAAEKESELGSIDD